MAVWAQSSWADAAPQEAPQPPTLQTAESSTDQNPPKRMWELDGAVFKSLSSRDSNQLGAARLLARRFLNDYLSAGADFRFWPAGSYPLTANSGGGAWALGAAGQIYLFRNAHVGAYLGSSLLWVPTDSEAALAPEVGFKWFASQRIALGVSYWILTDIGSYTTSFEPPTAGKSRQSLGLELSVYL